MTWPEQARVAEGSGTVRPMKAWVVDTPGPMASGPLVLVDRPGPEPGPGEIRVRVSACGVCRTDLHLAEGDLPPHRPTIVPGHEVVGVVDAVGPGCRAVRGRRPGRHRLAAPHLRPVPLLPARAPRTCASTRASPAGTPTAATPSYAVVDEAYAYRLPDGLRRRARRPAAVRRHHRLPGAAAGRAAARRPARHLRLRGVGPPRRPGRAGPGRDRARVHPLRRRPERHALDLGRRTRPATPTRRRPRAARRRHPVRPGRRARARRRSPRSTGAARWPSPAST